MFLDTTFTDYVVHWHRSCHKRIAHERTMATPRNSLGAHDSRWFLHAEVNKLMQRLAKIVGLHVVSIALKGFVMPRTVDRTFYYRSQSTKLFEIYIFYFSLW